MSPAVSDAMCTVPLDRLQVSGCAETEVTEAGVVIHRYPCWARNQIPDPNFARIETMPAGCRIEMTTDAAAIELDVSLALLRSGHKPVPTVTFDLVVEGRLWASALTDEATIVDLDPLSDRIEVATVSGPATIRFDNLPTAGCRLLSIWLPHVAAVEIQQMRISQGATFLPTYVDGPRWIHYGSSISHCMEASKPTATWPAIVALRTGMALTNLAVAGQCMLDQCVARIIRDGQADLITLKAGINILNADVMRERAFVPLLHGFLDTIRDGHPLTPLVVVSPIYCADAEDHPGPRRLGPNSSFYMVDRPMELATGALTLRRVRALMRTAVEARRAAGDENLFYVDGLSLFGSGDAAELPDGLHPSEAGYRRIADRFVAELSPFVGNRLGTSPREERLDRPTSQPEDAARTRPS